MKKNTTIIVIMLIIRSSCIAQDPWLDAIKDRWSVANDDTSRVLVMGEFCGYYKLKKPDSALFYGYKALTLARQIGFQRGEVRAMNGLVITQINLGNNLKALQLISQASKIAEKNDLSWDKALLIVDKGNIYLRSEDYVRALSLFRESKMLFDSVHDSAFSIWTQSNIGLTYLMLNKQDSALYHCQIAYANAVQLNASWVTHLALLNLGKIQGHKGNADLALEYFRQSLIMAGEATAIFQTQYSIAQLFRQIDKPDSSIYYARKSLEIAKNGGFYSDVIDASILLSDIYEKQDPQQALHYNRMAIAFKDSLYNLGSAAGFENLTAFEQQDRLYEIKAAKKAYQNQVSQYALLAGLAVLLLIAFILYRNNRQKQKANKVLESTLSNLKSTQSQLIQSEKMASLGELTAGIAHEIQNPLNFVNNFSEVNKELIGEMKEAVEKGNYDEVKIIAKDIEENEEKINHHGKRADAIVKGMLQHSRSSTGIKEPTDINALCDEYIRLTYHGLRAKDKSFNVTIKTDFDQTIDTINILSQDIGRVILNLLTNAFYVVNEKKQLNIPGYEPTVSINTKKINNKVEIRVADNGNGIPQKVLDKIFQPFFTTKPTGQGTGLGLSLSYDIVTKGHGGELKVETKEGEGSEFIIQLPA